VNLGRRRRAQGGVDLSLLDRFALSTVSALDLNTLAFKALSEPAALLAVVPGAQGGGAPRQTVLTALHRGTAHALAFWCAPGARSRPRGAESMPYAGLVRLVRKEGRDVSS